MKTFFKKGHQFIQTHPRLCEALFLILIFSISLIFKRIGLKFGFPLLTHPDESVIINPVLDMTRLRTLNSGNFNRPDQILQYLNLIYLNIISFILYGQDFASAYNEHFLNFYFYSRFLISVLGSLIPVVAYKIGKTVNNRLAISAAIVFAFFPLFTRYSLYITPDIPITLFTLTIIYFALRYLQTNKEKFIILATIFVAINTAEKYPGLLSFLIVLVALGLQVIGDQTEPFSHRIRTFLLRSLKMAGIFILALFIVAPYLFIEYSSVIEALVREARTNHLGADNLGFLGNLWFYVETFYDHTGILGVFFFLTGAFAFFRKFSKQNLLLFFGLFYWISLSVLALHWERWGLPMFITPLFFIAIGISYLLEEKSARTRIFNLLTGLAIILFISQQSIYSLYIPIQKKYVDTRVVSSDYCDMVGITKENSLFDGYTPLEPNTPIKIVDGFYDELANKNYILLSSTIYDRYFAEPERYQDAIAIYNEIRNSYPLIKTFTPYPKTEKTLGQLENILYFCKYRLGLTSEVRLSGPTIEIYQIAN